MNYWPLKIILIGLFLIVSLFNICYAETNTREQMEKEIDVYWQRLKQTADNRYGGVDVEVSVSGGLETRTNVWGSDHGPYADIKVKVPIYSKEEKIVQAEQKQAFLRKGAEYLRILETRAEKLALLKQKAKIYKAFINENGVKGAESYFQVLEDIITLENEIKEAKRCLNSMIS